MDEFFKKLFFEDDPPRKKEDPSFDFNDFKHWFDSQDEELNEHIEQERKAKYRKKYFHYRKKKT